MLPAEPEIAVEAAALPATILLRDRTPRERRYEAAGPASPAGASHARGSIMAHLGKSCGIAFNTCPGQWWQFVSLQTPRCRLSHGPLRQKSRKRYHFFVRPRGIYRVGRTSEGRNGAQPDMGSATHHQQGTENAPAPARRGAAGDQARRLRRAPHGRRCGRGQHFTRRAISLFQEQGRPVPQPDRRHSQGTVTRPAARAGTVSGTIRSPRFAESNEGYLVHYHANRDIMRAFIEATTVDARICDMWWWMRQRPSTASSPRSSATSTSQRSKVFRPASSPMPWHRRSSRAPMSGMRARPLTRRLSRCRRPPRCLPASVSRHLGPASCVP